MKHMKKIAFFTLVIFSLFTIVACGAKEVPPAPSMSETPSASTAPKEKVNVATLAGPTGMGMAKIMEDNEAGAARNEYDFTLATAPDQIVAKLTSKEIDIAAIPANLAATLYNKTEGGIQMAAINTLGMMYIMQNIKTEDGSDGIKTLADLEGKTIVLAGQGSTPEYVLNYLLEENGLGGKVTLEFVSEHSEVVSLMVAGKADFCLLPEPFVTTLQQKADNAQIVIKTNTEWETLLKKDGKTGDIVMGCVVVRKEFAENNGAALAAFLKDYYSSVEYTNNFPADAAKLIVKHGILADEALAEATIPTAAIVYIDGAIMKEAIVTFFDVLYAANPASLGGALPKDDFYYEK
ncbi:MAG: ABC transporter substrate-binding protein [Christensenellaceae bacterium]|jgi:NitT/TauT family transport system substrate-binding protein